MTPNSALYWHVVLLKACQLINLKVDVSVYSFGNRVLVQLKLKPDLVLCGAKSLLTVLPIATGNDPLDSRRSHEEAE
jgi:hypothetical protein